MKKSAILAVFAVSFAGSVLAASTVSDVVARQRWPWSETIDIDYTLSGDKGDVTFSATWDGQATPVILGTDFQVEAGQHRFEWSPTNNYAGQTLTGFTVTAEACDFDAHKYIVLDLVDGGYMFTNAPPAGGWGADDAYKSTKMVFARCPAGTYTNGMVRADLTYLNNGTDLASALRVCYGQHITTFTSDWYISIWALTDAQYSQVMSGTSGSSYAAKSASYNTYRGQTNDTPAINWPHTKYAVTENSFVDRLRKKSNGHLCIDLPTEEQFESALRAGASTYWPNGGTRTDSMEALTNILDQVANWCPVTTAVGLKNPNAWGVYDISGYGAASVCLDTAEPNAGLKYPSKNVGDATDPVGYRGYDVGNPKLLRVVKGSSGSASKNDPLYLFLPSIRWLGAQSNSYNVRFAIHLKPLNFGD